MFSNGNSFGWGRAVIATGSSPVGESPCSGSGPAMARAGKASPSQSPPGSGSTPGS